MDYVKYFIYRGRETVFKLWILENGNIQTTKWILPLDDTCWFLNVLGLFATCELFGIILSLFFSFFPWELYMSATSEQ